MTRSEPTSVTIDSAALHALAHPLRSRLLGALRLHGPATSAGLAERLATNTGQTSYHLRKLAAVGLIEEDPDRGTARERWWRAAHDLTSFADSAFDDDPNDRAAVEWLLREHLRLTTRWREQWLRTRSAWPVEWRDVASLNDVRLRCTPAQAQALHDELWGVVQRHLHLIPDPTADRPSEAASDVMVLLDIFPVSEVEV